jgi:predicted permease
MFSSSKLRAKPWSILVLAAVSSGLLLALTVTLKALIYEPLDYPEPENLFLLFSSTPKIPQALISTSDWNRIDQRASTLLSAVGAFRSEQVTLATATEAKRLAVARVSARYMPMLGVRPALGRIIDERDMSGSDPAIVLSWKTWTALFGRDPGIIGRHLRIDGRSAIVAGVTVPETENIFATTPDAWMLLQPETSVARQALRSLFVVARFRPSVSQSALRSALLAAVSDNADDRGWDFLVQPLKEVVVSPLKPYLTASAFGVLALAVASMLNIAGLLGEQAITERSETALRSCLGASRLRLAYERLVRNLPFVLLGVSLGACAACGLVMVLHQTGQLLLSRLNDVELPSLWLVAVVASPFVALVSVAAFANASLAPASFSFLRETHYGFTGRPRSHWRGIVAGELALCLLLLLSSAGIAIDAWRHWATNAGFDADGLYSVRYTLNSARYPTAEARNVFAANILDGLSGTPGLSGAAAADYVTDAGFSHPATVQIKEEPAVVAEFRVVTESYFGVMNVKVVDGRSFNRSDDTAERGLVINEAMKSRLGLSDAVGARLSVNLYPSRSIQGSLERSGVVLGVVTDFEHVAGIGFAPAVYAPLFHDPEPSLSIVVRAPGPGATKRIVSLAALQDPDLAPDDVSAVADLLGRPYATERFAVVLIAATGFATATVSLLGLVSLLASVVARRLRDCGIRAALGAGRFATARPILSEAAWTGGGACLVGAVLWFGVVSALVGRGMGVSVPSGSAVVIVFVGFGLACVVVTLLVARRVWNRGVVELLRC